jgi:hypothetical protein
MSRISSLLLVTGLSILPVVAFAQQNATPVQPAAPASQPAATPAPMSKAPAPGVKTTVSKKETGSNHAKLGTTTPAAPAKTVEPGKS